MSNALNALVRHGANSDLGFDGITRYRPGTTQPTAVWAQPAGC